MSLFKWKFRKDPRTQDSIWYFVYGKVNKIVYEIIFYSNSTYDWYRGQRNVFSVENNDETISIPDLGDGAFRQLIKNIFIWDFKNE